MSNTSFAFQYTKIFDPPRAYKPTTDRQSAAAGDERISPVYAYDDNIVLAINVALATQRPILVRGPSGCGKSSLARNVAEHERWRYYEKVITSRTQARDLLWEVDLLRRLHDAQARDTEFIEDYAPYIVPGALWWAFNPQTAAWRGSAKGVRGVTEVRDPAAPRQSKRAVVLIDEIDKADPDVPNNLLVPLGSLSFQVEETGATITTDADAAPLVFITTNDERELPKAFLRRCVELKIDWPTRDRLIEIASTHGEKLGVSEADMRALAITLLGPDDSPEEVVDISPAEFIDTIRATRRLQVKPGTEAWQALAGITVWKHGRGQKP